MKKIMKEFKAFAIKGNMIDLSVNQKSVLKLQDVLTVHQSLQSNGYER